MVDQRLGKLIVKGQTANIRAHENIVALEPWLLSEAEKISESLIPILLLLGIRAELTLHSPM